jgi:hypothetical protein
VPGGGWRNFKVKDAGTASSQTLAPALRRKSRKISELDARELGEFAEPRAGRHHGRVTPPAGFEPILSVERPLHIHFTAMPGTEP